MAFEFVEVKLLRAICRFLPYVIASTVRCAAIRFSFKGFTDSFALITLALPKSCYSLGARTTFDRGASFCSLYPAPQALATSLRMTGRRIFLSSVRLNKLHSLLLQFMAFITYCY